VRQPRAALALLVAGAAACASHRPAPVDPRGEFALSVINHHWLDVTIYVVHNGERTRVATREVYLIGDVVGSPEVVRTEILLVQPGQYIEWTLENPLRRSSVAVY